MDSTLTCNRHKVVFLTPRLKSCRRILLWGEMGVGKSTLAIKLMHSLSLSVGHCRILELDPGTPPFGVPGAVTHGWWNKDQGLVWKDCQALCTLNAGRFRLPLTFAAQSLLKSINREEEDCPLLIDPPGVVRGVGGAELLMALAESLGVDMVVVLHREKAKIPLAQELASLTAEIVLVPACAEAKRPCKLERMKQRTKLWNSFLANAVEETVHLDDLQILGTPPPLEVGEAWTDRQAALLDAKGRTVRMGEVTALRNKELTMRMVPGEDVPPVSLLVRDAGRDASSRLVTVPPVSKPFVPGREPVEMIPPVLVPQAGFQPLSSHLGPAWATLVGGVLGDPLLHVRLRDLKKSFLFDLGDPARLAAKVAHQVGGVFLSHAHLDHVMGFTWFLRSRIGILKPCKIFGPSNTIERIESFICGVTWDRIGEKGPIFEVSEIDGTTLKRARLQPGKPRIELPDLFIDDGVILSSENFTIKAVVCDHKTPSVAYALIFCREVKVRKDRLAAYGLSPGPWLGRLKYCIAQETPEAEIELPDGNKRKAGELAAELTIISPGKKLVYAADMADTQDNRKKLTEFAQSAHTFFCETAFTQADKDKAEANQHLTTLAAVDIARDAGVKNLVPFHFSKRYHHDYRLLYEEILAAAGSVRILGHFLRTH